MPKALEEPTKYEDLPVEGRNAVDMAAIAVNTMRIANALDQIAESQKALAEIEKLRNEWLSSVGTWLRDVAPQTSREMGSATETRRTIRVELVG